MANEHRFLAGGGEMGGLIRTMDWSKSPLGPIENWPQSLRSALSILLPSKAQIILTWGDQFTIFYNDAYRPVFGEKHPHALGKPMSEAWGELWSVGLSQLFEGVVNTGEAYWAQDLPLYVERHGYREETYFDISYDPVRDESDNVAGVFCIVSETSRRVIGDRRLHTLRDLGQIAHARTVAEVFKSAAEVLESSIDIPFAVFYATEAGTDQQTLMAVTGVPLSSRVASQTLPASGTIEWPLTDELCAITDDRLDSLRDIPGLTDLAEVVTVPLANVAKDELHGHVVLGINPLARLDDDYRDFLRMIVGTIASAIASAKKSEEERQRAESLAELDRAKTAFFTNISHEFRTPLTLMLGPLEEAVKSGSLDGEELVLAHRNSRRLLRLVNGLLDFARIQAGRLKVNAVNVDLPKLTYELASVFRSATERAGLVLSIQTEPLSSPVKLDVEMYEKIVSNLLSNAIKFTKAGKVSVLLRDAGSSVELTVSDTGVGVSPAQVPHLFERFYRVEGTWSRTHEGSGIGLSLLRDLVGLHGGTVMADSVIGEGTQFVVTLPKARPEGDALNAPDAEQSFRDEKVSGHGIALANEAASWSISQEINESIEEASAVSTSEAQLTAHILIVDDSLDMRDYLARLLGQRFEVSTAIDGLDALEKIARRPPDLVVTDVMMPRLDGFGFLAALKASPSTQTIPVILLSARAGEEARLDALQAGADDYIVKPFSSRELIARIESRLLTLRLTSLQREQSRRLTQMFEQTPVGIALLKGSKHHFEFANDAYLHLVNDRPLIGLSIRDAFPELAGQGIYELLDEVYESGKPYRAQSMRLLINDSSGTAHERFFDFVYQPMIDDFGHSTGISVVVYDVSELTAARREAERANRAKDEFMAMLGHELRNPLAPIVTVMQIMRVKNSNVLQRERDVLERQIGRLVRLVDDLLDVSRIASGKIELRKARMDLRDALNVALEAATPELQRQGHNVNLNIAATPLWINADHGRIEQILANVLVNAAKYTPVGGKVDVTAQQVGNLAEVCVADNGIGISEEMLPQVFNLFTQERQSIERPAGGLGLGLAIVRSLVEAHDGRALVFSPGIGLGSEFKILLPLLHASSNEHEILAATHSSVTGKRSRVLIVDDNEDAALVLSDFLQLSGFDTRVALDGPRALEMAAYFEPETAVLDIGLPVMNGEELAHLLKRDYPDIKLVAVTGYGKSVNSNIDNSPFDGRFLKPVDVNALLNFIATKC